MEQAIACNLNAISTDHRPRYTDLVKRLGRALHQENELPDGYAYRVDTNQISLMELAEWITLERRCCPFLSFELKMSGSDLKMPGSDAPRLVLTGPAGTKPILSSAFHG